MDRSKERLGNLESFPLDQMIECPENPRVYKDSDISALCENIYAFGNYRPIILDQNNRIAAGHKLRKALMRLGNTTAPVHRIELSDEEFYQLLLADNKMAELGKVDKKQMKTVMEILGKSESASLPGFSAEYVDKIFGHKHESTTASENATANFGESGEVTLEKEDNRESIVKRKTFILTEKEHELMTKKLKAIVKEHELKTEAEAILLLLKNVKVAAPPIKKKGPVAVSHPEED